MEARQDKRTNYTREQFIDKVWEWKHESGGTITRQLRRLGCSMDWSREQFTMDEHFSNAVLKVFVDLHAKGLIYRDKRLVNWDPKLKTAISDLEVETQDVKGHFWHFRYPLEEGATLADGRDYIEVATTRPETMLADMAVAVHPDDDRYKSVVGKHVVLPITGRRVPIVADEHAHPELGFEEERTAKLVADHLEGFGYQVERGVGGTGVVGTLRNGESSRTIGLRADMDALPIQESNEFDYRSKILFQLNLLVF